MNNIKSLFGILVIFSMMVGSVKATSGKIAKGPAARGVKRSGTDISEDTPLGDSRMKDDCIDDDSVSDAHSASLKKIKKHQALGISCDQSRLREIAEKQGFGYKTANLQELQRVCAAFNPKSIGSIQIAVPAFLGIPSNKIQEKLLMVGFDCSAQWSGVVETITDKQKVFEDKQFPATFLAARSDFNQALNDAWKKFVLLPDQGLDDFFVGVVGLDALLADVASRGNRLMVRSTGKEDTRELANAGGNTSVSNVEPTPAAVLAAIREVVESYFGMKSLTQRLGLGDASLFSAEAFTPVLIQEMVGEKSSDKKPLRCGVMFTEEPEGAIKSAGDEPVAHIQKTTGITLIQAAYGHNEGVVNSLIPVDTYYIMPGENPAIYPVIRAKKSRLVPEANSSSALKTVKNEKSLVLTRTLSDRQLHTLKMFADCLESYYGYPMDVEFVIKDNIIFIVQARPIVHKKEVAGPSYLRDGLVGTMFKADTIGAAGGSVREINSKDQVLVASTIGGALNSYLSKDFNGKNIKAVLVGAMAPSTSHEATTFRNEGVPVLYVEEWSSLSSSILSGKKLLVSPQQNMVIVVDSVTDGDILSGWNSYPIPRALSVISPLLGRIKTVNGEKFPPARKVREKWDAFFIDMKRGSAEQVIEATASFLAQFNLVLKKYTPHKSLVADVNSLLLSAKILCQQIVALSHYSIDSECYLCRLLPIKMLESLVYQQLGYQDVFKPLSLATLAKILKDETIINEGGSIANISSRSEVHSGAGLATIGVEASLPTFADQKTRDYYVQLRKLDNNIFVESIREHWDWFLGEVAKNQGLMNNLALFVKRLSSVFLLPTWLHSDFANMDGVYKNPEAVAGALSSWQEKWNKDKDFLKELLEKYSIVKDMNLSAFSDPSRCKALWKKFNEQVVAYFAGDDFKASFDSAGDYGHQAAVQILRKLIVVFDEAIKGVKGNAALPNVDKVAMFKEMLLSNFELLKNGMSLVPTATSTEPHDPLALNVSSETFREVFIEMIHDSLQRPFGEGDLLPTPGFSAVIFSLGSGHDWFSEDRGLPQTGEDVFSVMHQSLLYICSVLSIGEVKLDCPRVLTLAEDALIRAGGMVIHKFFDSPLVSNFTGADVDASSMTVYYNIPLGMHSCQVGLTYFHKTQSIEVKAHFCGGSRGERFRWCDIAIEALLANNNEHMKVALNELSNHLVTVSMQFSESSIPIVERLWKCLLEIASENHDFSLDPSREKSIDEYKALLQTLLSFSHDGIGAEAAGIVLKRYELFSNQVFSPIILQLIDIAAQRGEIDILLKYLEKSTLPPDYDFEKLATVIGPKCTAKAKTAFFEEMLKREKCFDQAALFLSQYAEKTIDFSSYEARDEVDKVFCLALSLIKKGHGFKEAELLVEKYLLELDPEVFWFINLLQALVEHGFAYDSASNVVSKFLNSENSAIESPLVQNLLYTLIDKGQRHLLDIGKILDFVIEKFRKNRLICDKNKLYSKLFIEIQTMLLHQGHEKDVLFRACVKLKKYCVDPLHFDRELVKEITDLQNKIIPYLQDKLDKDAASLPLPLYGFPEYYEALKNALQLCGVRMDSINTVDQKKRACRQAHVITLEKIIEVFDPLKGENDKLIFYKVLMFERQHSP